MSDIAAPDTPAPPEGVGQQVTAINKQIDSLSKAGLPPEGGPEKSIFDGLVSKRDALVSRAKKAGVNVADMMKASKTTDAAVEPNKKAADASVKGLMYDTALSP